MKSFLVLCLTVLLSVLPWQGEALSWDRGSDEANEEVKRGCIPPGRLCNFHCVCCSGRCQGRCTRLPRCLPRTRYAVRRRKCLPPGKPCSRTDRCCSGLFCRRTCARK